MDEPNQEPHRYEARKLDFNLPLLSTRRHGRRCDDDNEVEQLSCSTAANSINLPHRVPFCWERAPGRPVNDAGDDQDGWTPRLRLPPCRWHPTQTDDVVQDEGCDADVDEDGYEGDYYYNNDDNNNSNSYSNVDALSLTEAIDIAQRGDGEFGRRERFSVSSSRNGNDGAGGGGGGGSPNFMMERFLPDATALAASSVLYSTNKMLPFYAPDSNSPASVVSDKGCGLDALLPWRTKHKLCNAKSPVRRQAPQPPPWLSAKQKRDHRSAGK